MTERSGNSKDKNALYRSIPKVDALLLDERIEELGARYGHAFVMSVIREKTDELRDLIRRSGSEEEMESASDRIGRLIPDIAAAAEKLHAPHLHKVINATGTILHTNLGRAPLSRCHAEQLTEVLSGYSNLEYDPETGRRTDRLAYVTELICRLTGAEDALVVNNNAAAVMLALNTLAKGGEVPVSRGELVEIGGRFRIPEVMAASGAILREIGTTNRTYPSDYEEAVTDETKALLKVNTSNYRIVGFSGAVSAAELKVIADRHGLPLVQDMGSGALIDPEKFGLSHEETVRDSLIRGVDVVCFSGDKLLGGPQAGIAAGKRKYISLMRANQLSRAFRVDKYTVAVLEMVLTDYLDEEEAARRIPVLRMLSEPSGSVRKRAETLLKLLRDGIPGVGLTLEPCESCIGGGSLPLETIRSTALVIHPKRMSAGELGEELRRMPCPVLARIREDAVWLDMRTVDEEDSGILAAELLALQNAERGKLCQDKLCQDKLCQDKPCQDKLCQDKLCQVKPCRAPGAGVYTSL